jgi:hypothetical protein
MFGADGKMVFQSAWKDAFSVSWAKSQETLLQEGERILGIKSFMNSKD